MKKIFLEGVKDKEKQRLKVSTFMYIQVGSQMKKIILPQVVRCSFKEVSWSSKKQTCIADSTMASKFIVLASAEKEA